MELQFWLGVLVGFSGLLVIELAGAVAFVAWSLKAQARAKEIELEKIQAEALLAADRDFMSAGTEKELGE